MSTGNSISSSPASTVAVAVSGGVDSLCALVMLQQAGHRVLALHGLFLPDAAPEPPSGLAVACAALGVPLHVADLRPVFEREVLAPFAAAYAAGRTPNPCALCNRAIKFGALFDVAMALGAQKLATGHYARLAPAPEDTAPARSPEALPQPPEALPRSPAELNTAAVSGNAGLFISEGGCPPPCPGLGPLSSNTGVFTDDGGCGCLNRQHGVHAGRDDCDDCAEGRPDVRGAQGTCGMHPPLLAAAYDAAKDQSYFLSLVPRERLALACFPLAQQDKARSREIVARAGLVVPVPHESQDICFAPPVVASAGQCAADAYRPFLERRWQQAAIVPPGQGPVFLRDAAGGLREIARHKGLWRYTEGQRKGLGIAYSEPLYVLAKDGAGNALVVGPRALLGVTRCRTGKANVLLPPRYWAGELLVRLRHRQRPSPAVVALDALGRLDIHFAEPQFPSAPGQVAAVYDGQGHVLAAGIVEDMA